ncbi:MAG: class II aldolase/adducin family protein [Chloroflexi bacterium]|nr:class II aldolase/adducin family protein [Chloroflexota bacterium]
MDVNDLDLKTELIQICHQLVALGYLIGTYGNASARVPGGLIITPSRVDYAHLTPEDMVTVSDEGEILAGTRLPSSELEVHRQIYLRRPDVNAVLHTHSLHATALSCCHDTIPVIVEEQSQVVGGEIYCTRYIPAGRHEDLGEETARALGTSNAVLIANHGVVNCGRSLDEALFVCLVVERIAQMRLLTGAGAVVPIPPEHVASERDRFLHRYGTAADREDAEPAEAQSG